MFHLICFSNLPKSKDAAHVKQLPLIPSVGDPFFTPVTSRPLVLSLLMQEQRNKRTCVELQSTQTSAKAEQSFICPDLHSDTHSDKLIVHNLPLSCGHLNESFCSCAYLAGSLKVDTCLCRLNVMHLRVRAVYLK